MLILAKISCDQSTALGTNMSKRRLVFQIGSSISYRVFRLIGKAFFRTFLLDGIPVLQKIILNELPKKRSAS